MGGTWGYAASGLVGPLPLDRPEAIDSVDRSVITADDDLDAVLSPHLRDDSFLALCADQAILRCVTELLGTPTVSVWATSLFRKEPGGLPFHPHQDALSWHLEPLRAVTAWVALDDATEENGALRVAPGSHLEALPRVRQPGGVSSKTVDPEALARFTVEVVPVRRGSFITFHPLLVHGSGVNHTDRARWALAIRYAAPEVHVDYDGFSMFQGRPDLRRTVVLGVR
jgi:ectoine hydroxylase-related dioxygenase (phytanoyl-CoA dioxygenase family)